MIIYRYEKEDGGGPFCTPDGILRTNSEIKFKDDWLSGCSSKKELVKWFRDRNIDVSDCIIKTYVVNIEDIKYNRSHLLFHK